MPKPNPTALLTFRQTKQKQINALTSRPEMVPTNPSHQRTQRIIELS